MILKEARRGKRWDLLFACVSVILTIGWCDGDVNTTRLQEVMTTLARQTMMQQLVMEERIRSSGHSGLKQIRFNKDGTRAYSTSSHIGHNIASIHDHTDHYKTVGMGEVVGVLNGVDFRSRHNDYMLRSPSTTSQAYRVTEEIEYPDVPPEVKDKSSVEDQIEEMRLWFKAWADQDNGTRDYTKYFKPVLCYMEGSWTETDFGKVQEPFESDRHHISAENWYDLQEKIRYTAYTGSKDKGENYAFLPTKIIDIDLETREPVYAQWNYRILCHPLKHDVPLSLLWPNGELHYRFTKRQSYSDYAKTRSCRYVINKKDQDRLYRWDILESMMNEIPGLNNYPGEMRDESFGRDVLNPYKSEPELLNAAYYHRFFKAAEADAMGQALGHRGFSDRNLYVAFTNHSEISPVSVKYCEKQVCDVNTARVSYAIPLEIIYLTPLHSWNPYNVTFWPKSQYKEATKNKRNGGFTPETALNGINSKQFYQTPVEFFEADSTEVDPADTAGKARGVLDQTGSVQNVTASGVRIFLPEIPGIRGNLRTRYPIFPVHEEGSTTYKEVEALREMMMDMGAYLELFKKAPYFGSGVESSEEDEQIERPGITLFTSWSDKNTVARHRHNVTLTYQEYVRVKVQRKHLEKLSSEEAEHTHNLRITYDTREERYRIFRCDKAKHCWDRHDKYLYETDPSEN